MVKYLLTHWGRVMHICVGNLTIISSDNGLLPGLRQAIIWTNAGILLNGPLWTKLQWNLNLNSIIFIKKNAFMWSTKLRPFYLGLNVLSKVHWCYIGGVNRPSGLPGSWTSPSWSAFPLTTPSWPQHGTPPAICFNAIPPHDYVIGYCSCEHHKDMNFPKTLPNH